MQNQIKQRKNNVRSIWGFYWFVILCFIALLAFSLLTIIKDEMSLKITEFYAKYITWMKEIDVSFYPVYGKILGYIYLTCTPFVLFYISGFHGKIYVKKHQTISKITWWLGIACIFLTIYIFFKYTKPYFEILPKFEGNDFKLLLGFIPIFGSFQDFLVNFKNIYVLYALPFILPLVLFIKSTNIMFSYGLSPKKYIMKFLIWSIILILILPFVIIYICYVLATIAVFGVCAIIGCFIWGSFANAPSSTPDKVVLSDGTVLTNRGGGDYVDGAGNHWDDLGNGTFEL